MKPWYRILLGRALLVVVATAEPFGQVFTSAPTRATLRVDAVASTDGLCVWKVLESPFSRSVLEIVLAGAKEQVVWANTLPIVAMVTHHEAIGNWTKREPIGDAMGTVRCLGVSGPVADDAIPLLVDNADPFPATVTLGDVPPKTFFEWKRRSLVTTLARTELAGGIDSSHETALACHTSGWSIGAFHA